MTVNMVLIEEAFAVLETGQMELDGQCVRGGGGGGAGALGGSFCYKPTTICCPLQRYKACEGATKELHNLKATSGCSMLYSDAGRLPVESAHCVLLHLLLHLHSVF